MEMRVGGYGRARPVRDAAGGRFRPGELSPSPGVRRRVRVPGGRRMRLLERLRRWLRLTPPVRATSGPGRRGRIDHVVILDGTMSSLEPGRETNAGLAYRLLSAAAGSAQMSLRYEQGVQWRTWRDVLAVIEGRGINRQIRRAYGFLASRYRPGDRIFLLGYSRGAYAVRSLAGMIDRLGLLRPESATERNIRLIWRHYRQGPDAPAARAFAARHCHPEVTIEMIGVWDTVKALGNPLPILWRHMRASHAFHDTRLGHTTRRGFHALAMDETRVAYAPVLWSSRPGWRGELEQVWFRGAHGDIGGQLDGFEAARPLSNIPFVWMMERLEACGLPLPEGWKERFPQDVTAPSVGTTRGWGKFFLYRSRRVIGRDPSERIHPSVAEYEAWRGAQARQPALRVPRPGGKG